MRGRGGLDSSFSPIWAFFGRFQPLGPAQLKVAWRGALAIIPPLKKCGCSSVVEHLLAKEDVASSSLVTRSSFRSAAQRLTKAGASAPTPRRRRTAQRPPSYGWQARVLMHYVYLLKSRSHPSEQYLGSTGDLLKRLREHNEGHSVHTAKFRPWTLIAYIAFPDKKTAIAFEKYLKSSSGRAFIKRHFL